MRPSFTILLALLVALQPAHADDRSWSVEMMTRIAEPVLRSAARGTLKTELPLGEGEASRAPFTHLEALGRTIAGIAPWLELGPDESDEGKRREEFILLAVEAISRSTDPRSSAYLNFSSDRQPLVDTAFLALGILRAPNQLWGRLSQIQRKNVVAAFSAARKLPARLNNWLMFQAVVETAICKTTKSCDIERIQAAVSETLGFYAGDGVYGDGARVDNGYYNSYVIQPMLLTVIDSMSSRLPALAAKKKLTHERARRYAEILEKMVSPEGTFPVIGRSAAYRFGVFHHLAYMALRHDLPKTLRPAGVRSAITSVIKRMTAESGTFDDDNWLRVGVIGHQPGARERYISTGSLYLAMAGFVHLGLPATDPFWSAPGEDWTQRKIWDGKDFAHDTPLQSDKRIRTISSSL